MAYKSLLNMISEEYSSFDNARREQGYNGTLEEILNDLKGILSRGERETKPAKLALHAPRIIRAFVDYKIENPDKSKIEDLLKDSIELGLNIYKGEENVLKELEELEEKTQELEYHDLFSKSLIQEDDLATWYSTDPELSEQTSNKLVSKLKGNPIFFLALGHGGVAAGMDTYLRYCDKTKNEDSDFYVVRFSNHKHKDMKPQLSKTEKKYLKKEIKNRDFVLFDEDKITGYTMEKANKYFSQKLMPLSSKIFSKKKIIEIANVDKSENIYY